MDETHVAKVAQARQRIETWTCTLLFDMKLGLVVEGLPCRVELLTGKRIPHACLHGAVLSFGIRSCSLIKGTESEPSDI
jgi:hypothetical protein